MFSGIIENSTQLIENKGDCISVANPFPLAELSVGQSISVNGCCLTLTDFSVELLHFSLSSETLCKTTFKNLKPKDVMNLERSLKFGDRLDGHMVSGHVDQTVHILSFETRDANGSKELRLTLPKHLKPFISPKGSISVDGISLTINTVETDFFSVMIIPHTLNVTNLKYKKMGDCVNLEIDLFARHIWNMLQNQSLPATQ